MCVFDLGWGWWCRALMRGTQLCGCWAHRVVRWMWVVGAKFVCSRVSPPVMPCFWVVLTGFRMLVRRGCGGFVGWQMVSLCLSVSLEWVSGGVLSHGVFGLGIGIWRVWVVFGGFLGQFSIFGRVCVGCAFLLWGSWDDCPKWIGTGSCWLSCFEQFCEGGL